MIIKQIPEDFIVNEITNIESFKSKEEDSKPYYYFKLTKTNYEQIKAIRELANKFNTSPKRIHFAGTKDKVGVTTQIISIYDLKEENIEKNVEFVNEKVKDIEVQFIGKFKGRINLGDNLGNEFIITVRSLEKEDIEKVKNNLENIKENGVLNYFDSQRFGFANNSHLIGKYVLKNELENAVKEILTSLPKDPSEDLEEFVKYINDNWNKIKESNEETINKAIELVPTFFRDAKPILLHLKKAKNDFPGAFRTIHKKLRTIYINAYQSYIFNKTIKNNSKITLGELPLITSKTILPNEIKDYTNKLLEDDNLTQEEFKLKSSPELQFKSEVKRKIRIKPKNIQLNKEESDELNKNKLKIKISFKLGSGEYATNVIKQLFE